MDIRKCKHCDQEFVNVNAKWFSNHVRWCDKNPKKDITNILVANEKAMIKRFGDFKNFEVYCLKCNTLVIVKEREKLFPQKEKYYCGKSCSNSHARTDEIKQKIREGVLKSIPPDKRNQISMVCPACNKTFTGRRGQTYCSKKCGCFERKASTEYLQYKADCKFKFNVWDYPEEFELSLIYKHGWYKAKNRGDNTGGVSRDHKISVKYGWENGIDPEIISHPANCELMVHSENISKHKKCSVVLENLKEDIKQWETKYVS